MKKSIIIFVAVVLVVIAGVLVFAKRDHKSGDTNTSTTPAQSSSSQSSTAANPTPETMTATITYTDDGFSPSKITVTEGATITLKNESSTGVSLKSDPHPSHTNNTELNQDTLDAGKSLTFTVNKVGSWGYHNHFSPSEKGTIVVQAK